MLFFVLSDIKQSNEENMEQIQQIVNETEFTVIPNLRARCVKIKKIEEKLTCSYPNHQSNLYIGVDSAPPKIARPKQCNDNEYAIWKQLKSQFILGPQYFSDYGKLIREIAQLYLAGRQVGAYIYYEMSSNNGAIKLFINTYHKEQWVCLSQEEGRQSRLWLDLRQYKKWYQSQREIAEQSAGQSQRGIEVTREEWMAIKMLSKEKQYELRTTLQRIHSEIEQGEHYHFIEAERVQRTTRLEPFLRCGKDKMLMYYDPMSYVNLLNGIQDQIQIEDEYTERAVKASYEEEDWLKRNIHLLNTLVRQINVVLPMLNVLSTNLEDISNHNREKVVHNY